jgi:glycosyltransferase involved in cell wall biosynthesis
VIAVQEFIKKIDGFYSKEIIIREINFGLAKSFIEGITETLKKYEYAIFLEDDNFVSPSFLKYMNLVLLRYKDNVKVSCVTGYTYPIFPRSRKPYFLLGANTWSMGTWRRAWENFNPNSEILLTEIEGRGLVSNLDQGGFHFYNMLSRQARGELDSWGVRWVASAVIKDLYCLYPPKPLCINIGFGDESTHTKKKNLLMYSENSLSSQIPKYFPSKIKNIKSLKFRFILMNHRLNFISKFS